MSSKDESIIKRSDSTTDIFRKWDEFITAAKAAKLIDIFNGKTSVKSDEEVEADNKSRLSYLKTALIKHTLIQEGIITTQIIQEIEANQLYAYFYATDIIAADPTFQQKRNGLHLVLEFSTIRMLISTTSTSVEKKR